MKSNRILWAFIVLQVCICCMTYISADEWPQWRGPNRDGVWSEVGVVDKFEAGGLLIRWRQPVSSGYSGPTVADGKVFVTDLVKEPLRCERVHCLDAKTGEQLWLHTYPVTYKNIGYPAGPRACVTIDGKRAYSLGTMGHFFCLNTKDGSVIWKKDLNKEYGIRMPTWGISAAPVVENNLVIVQIGGKEGACVVAMDKKTGQEVWRALEDGPSYSAPILIEHVGKRILVCWTAEHIVGLEPTTGKAYFQYDYKPSRTGQNICTPVFSNGYIFVSSFFDGSALVKLLPGELALQEIWRRKGENERKTESLHCCISTAILLDDYIYGVGSYGQLRCLELLTGDRVWENLNAVPKARWANIHMVQNGERVWMFNERGELIISSLSPKGFEEISRVKLIEPTEDQLGERGGVCWSHPAFAYKCVFARNGREIICASLAVEDYKFKSTEEGD